MDCEHLGRNAFDRLLAGGFAEREMESHLFHLLVCEKCRGSLVTEHPEEGPLFLEQVFGDSQSWIHPRSILTRNPSLQREVLAAPRLMEELLSAPQAKRLLLARNLARFQTLPLAVACLGESKQLFRDDPREALHWADVALAVLSSLPGPSYEDSLIADFEARAWSYRANSLRNLSRLDEASEAFETAWRRFWEGSIVPVEWARIAALEASLRREQRRFQEGRSLLLDAIGIYREMGERREEARLRVAKAQLVREEGEAEQAAEILSEVVEEFSSEELGDFLRFAVLQSLTVGFAELGRAAEARAHFPEVKALAERLGERLTLIRITWLEGTICHAEGDHLGAEIRYRQARHSFIEQGLAHDAATVSLDLAVLYLETGRTSEVKALAAEMLPIFRSRQIHRDAAITGLVLIEALRQETATVERVQELVAYMRRTQGTHPAS